MSPITGCRSLGLAASITESSESTTTRLIQRGITRLLQTFPDAITQTGIDEYNARPDAEIQHVRYVVAMHYHLTNRRYTAYWRTVGGMEIPPSLRHRIELFREIGSVFHAPLELFAKNPGSKSCWGKESCPSDTIRSPT